MTGFLFANDQAAFRIEYAYSPSADSEERLARAYDLVIELILSNLIPEEDAVGAFPNVADAGEIIHSRQNKITRQLGESHV
jgi:hypothetical protein